VEELAAQDFRMASPAWQKGLQLFLGEIGRAWPLRRNN
jgi:hypothetical protein